MISAGFDAHVRDPLGDLTVTEEGFSAFTRILLRIARDHAQGRFAAILEGGYDLEGLETSVIHMLDEMGGGNIDLSLPEYERQGLLANVRAVQQRHWELPPMP